MKQGYGIDYPMPVMTVNAEDIKKATIVSKPVSGVVPWNPQYLKYL